MRHSIGLHLTKLIYTFICSPDMTMTLHVCMRDVLFQLIEEFNFVSQSE